VTQSARANRQIDQLTFLFKVIPPFSDFEFDHRTVQPDS
jgi:hypothetical protein